MKKNRQHQPEQGRIKEDRQHDKKRNETLRLTMERQNSLEEIWHDKQK